MIRPQKTRGSQIAQAVQPTKGSQGWAHGCSYGLGRGCSPGLQCPDLGVSQGGPPGKARASSSRDEAREFANPRQRTEHAVVARQHRQLELLLA